MDKINLFRSIEILKKEISLINYESEDDEAAGEFQGMLEHILETLESGKDDDTILRVAQSTGEEHLLAWHAPLGFKYSTVEMQPGVLYSGTPAGYFFVTEVREDRKYWWQKVDGSIVQVNPDTSILWTASKFMTNKECFELQKMHFKPKALLDILTKIKSTEAEIGLLKKELDTWIYLTEVPSANNYSLWKVQRQATEEKLRVYEAMLELLKISQKIP